MKTWMKVVLGIVAAIGLLLALIFWLTSDITKTGDDFFAAVQNDDIDAAYELLSPDFKAGTSKDELRAYLAANGLDKIAEVSWGGRSIENNRGRLNGTVTTESGGSIPLTIRLTNSDNGWQIYSIQKERAGFGSDPDGANLPTQSEQQALVKKSIHSFVDSLGEKDMGQFHAQSSSMWQQQYSVEKMNETYQTFFQFGEAFRVMKRNPIRITKPAFLNDDGVVEIQSRYNFEDANAFFTTLYVYEGTDWKLFGFFIDLKPI